jgi:hypothetical protein
MGVFYHCSIWRFPLSLFFLREKFHSGRVLNQFHDLRSTNARRMVSTLLLCTDAISALNGFYTNSWRIALSTAEIPSLRKRSELSFSGIIDNESELSTLHGGYFQSTAVVCAAEKEGKKDFGADTQISLFTSGSRIGCWKPINKKGSVYTSNRRGQVNRRALFSFALHFLTIFLPS